MGRLGHCDGCDCRLVPERPPAPMLHDHIWCQLADPREMLCLACMYMRAAQRDIQLSLASLKPVPVNLAVSRFSASLIAGVLPSVATFNGISGERHTSDAIVRR